MIHLKLKVLSALLLSLLFTLLSSCSSRELNSFNLVTALGIDKDEAGYLVTYQVLNPKVAASKKSDSESPVVIYSEKGDDLNLIERRTTTQAARKMYFSHIRSVVISEDLARDGIKDILDYLFRNTEFRSDFYYVIAKGTTANQILSVLTTIDSASGLKLYDSIENSKKWWAQTNSLKIIELVNDVNAIGKNPVLTGVEFYQKTENMDSMKSLEQTNPGKLKFTELGAFQDDRLVGWLDELESRAYNSIVGKTKNSVISVDFNENTRVSLNLKFKKTKTKVSISDGRPVIEVQFSAEMGISSVEGNADFTDIMNLNKLNSIVQEELIDISKKTLNKAQFELKTDIFGFGESIHRAYPKVWNELKDDWDTEFTNLQVNFVADTNILDLGEILKPIINEEE